MGEILTTAKKEKKNIWKMFMRDPVMHHGAVFSSVQHLFRSSLGQAAGSTPYLKQKAGLEYIKAISYLSARLKPAPAPAQKQAFKVLMDFIEKERNYDGLEPLINRLAGWLFRNKEFGQLAGAGKMLSGIKGSSSYNVGVDSSFFPGTLSFEQGVINGMIGSGSFDMSTGSFHVNGKHISFNSVAGKGGLNTLGGFYSGLPAPASTNPANNGTSQSSPGIFTGTVSSGQSAGQSSGQSSSGGGSSSPSIGAIWGYSIVAGASAGLVSGYIAASFGAAEAMGISGGAVIGSFVGLGLFIAFIVAMVLTVIVSEAGKGSGRTENSDIEAAGKKLEEEKKNSKNNSEASNEEEEDEDEEEDGDEEVAEGDPDPEPATEDATPNPEGDGKLVLSSAQLAKLAGMMNEIIRSKVSDTKEEGKDDYSGLDGSVIIKIRENNDGVTDPNPEDLDPAIGTLTIDYHYKWPVSDTKEEGNKKAPYDPIGRPPLPRNAPYASYGHVAVGGKAPGSTLLKISSRNGVAVFG